MATTATFSPETAAELEHTLEHFNANHADTVLLLARFAADCEPATDAEAVTVDPGGVELEVKVNGRATAARMVFAAPAATVADVQVQVLDRIREARALAGDRVPLTSMERELSATGSLTTFSTRVVAVSDLTPNLRLVELEGGLEGFESLGSEQFAYLFVPRPGVADVPEGYTMADFMATDPAARPWGAYYTVRTWDPDHGRISLWIVTHGHGDGVGAWAATCRVGERVALWGPREPFRPPEGTTSYLLVADESGLAAVAVMLEERPRATPATVIVETVDEDHRVDLRVSGAVDDVVDVRWRYRGDDAPGTGSRLLDAVRALDLDVDGLAAFGAAESRQVTAIRKYLRHERGMAPEQVSMTGYWRRD